MTTRPDTKYSIDHARRRLEAQGYTVKRHSFNYAQFEIELGNKTWIIDRLALPDFADRKLGSEPCN